MKQQHIANVLIWHLIYFNGKSQVKSVQWFECDCATNL